MLESILYFFALLGTLLSVLYLCLILLDLYLEHNEHCKQLYDADEQHQLLYLTLFFCIATASLWSIIYYLQIQSYL